MSEEVVCVRKERSGWVSYAVLAVGILFYVFFTRLQVPGLEAAGQKAFAFTIVVILLLVFEVFPIGITSVLAILLAPLLGIIKQADAFANFASGSLFFVLGVFILAVAFTSTGFGYRMSLYVSGLFGNKPSMVLLSYMIGTGVLSSVLADIPSAVIFGALAIEILKENKCLPGCSNFGRSIMIGIPIAATVGGIGTPAGGALNIMTISILEGMGFEITFLKWTMVCYPFAAVMLLISWFVLCKVFPAEIHTVKGLEQIEKKKQELGKITTVEKKYVCIFLLMLLLWFTQSITAIPLWTTAVGGVALFFLPGIRILKWKETVKEVNYEILLLLGGMNVIAYALNVTGAANWIANNTIGNVNNLAPWLVLVVTVAVGVYTHYIIPSSAAQLAVLTPIVCLMGAGVGLGPEIMAIAICLAAHVSTLLPFSEPVALTTYHYDYWTAWDMIKPSLIYGTLWIPVTVVFLLFYKMTGLLS